MGAPAAQDNSLNEGDFAPDFSVPTDGGGTFTLSEQRDKKNVVLYFYPKDATPGCTKEANQFTELNDQFAEADTVIIGMSKDDQKAHDKFKEKQCIPFTLGTDDTGTVCDAYGTWVEKNMYGKKYMGIQRDTFLIDKQGKISTIWRKVKVDGHAEEVLEKAKAL